MIFSVFYNVPNSIVTYRINTYDTTDPELYIPKFLLLKMANYCINKNKYMMNKVFKNNDSIILEYLIQGFKFLGIINNDMDESYVWKVVDNFLLSADVNRIRELYLEMTKVNENGYAVFSVLEEVD
jgi:hypothetical protein